MKYPRLVIAGTHSGVGKTTVTLALLAALKARGRRVQAFKVGPDFIDPGHHAALTGRPSRNLDGWMLGPTVSRQIFLKAAAGVDLSIIEGMMGLFDGSSPTDEKGSTAEAAKLLEAPVLLVIDGSAIARSAAALVLGYARFDPALQVAGVLFNRISGEGHYQLLKEAVEAETKLSVVGYLQLDTSLTIPDRHLGLVTALEQAGSSLYRRLAAAAAKTVDLDKIEVLANAAGELSAERPSARKPDGGDIRVGVAYDPAFCFYYPENLELLEGEGAQIIRFSPLYDSVLPEVELLYLGGGYPELHAEALARNEPMRTAIHSFAGNGGAIYAECGGMMYLMDTIRDFQGRSHKMVGLFSGEAAMHRSNLVLGYRELEITKTCVLGGPGMKARGHEFHYSTLVGAEALEYGCMITDARGRHCGLDGLIAGDTLALYTHLHFASQPALARSLLNSVRKKASRANP
jgi:cobyrinic acid a,c-diamide synthase